MFEALLGGAAIIFQAKVMLVILVSVFIAVIFGVIPGISGLTAMCLALPFIYLMEPRTALPMLVAFSAVGVTGGSLTACLIGIPGTPPNAATVIDGYPMTQKGEGGRAVGAAITASMFGGLLGVPITILMIPIVLPIILHFREPELCFLVLMGLSFLAVIGGQAIKGAISGGLGLLFSFIGFQSVTGVPRFSFESTFLYDGLSLIAVTLGLFGIPEMVGAIAKGQTTVVQQALTGKMSMVWEGVKDVYRHRWLFLRSGLIGHIVGMIPGIGGETAVWIAYGQAKQTSKHKEEFGKGCVEGVIAPEAANNSKEGGALLTTMTLGIPGSTTMALLLAGFVLVGVEPGPRMMIDHLPLGFALLFGVAIANVVAGAICCFMAPHLVKLVSINILLQFPAIITLIFVGAFVAGDNILHLIVVIIFGLLGIGMTRWGYSRPALLLGFILGNQFEYYFFHSLHIHGPLFFVTPICLVIIAITVALYSYPFIGRILSQRSKKV